MKNLVKKSNVINNVNAFGKFQNYELNIKQLKDVKGGEDIIVIEDVVGG